MRIKLGVDVNVTNVWKENYLCPVCEEPMKRWGVSFGTGGNLNHSNVWVHAHCIKKLNAKVKKHSSDEVARVDFARRVSGRIGYTTPLSLFSFVNDHDLDRYCSYCSSKIRPPLFVTLRKWGIHNQKIQTQTHCHTYCLREIEKKLKKLDYQELEDELLVEEI